MGRVETCGSTKHMFEPRGSSSLPLAARMHFNCGGLRQHLPPPPRAGAHARRLAGGIGRGQDANPVT
eukprot:365452-Chlamydomonas_euryale.AAC.16